MSQQTDLLYAVLALQMNFISKDQLVECGALWASDRKKSLPSILDRKGYLKPPAKKALEAMVEAQMAQFGDPEKSLVQLNVDDDVRRSLLALPLPDKVKGTLMEFKPGAKKPAPDAVETVVVTRTREERYNLGAEIGRGGLGRVVAGRDTILGREVAIKEMLPGAGDAGVIKRFLREGEIAGRLSHPNVIPVHDIGVREERGAKTPYFVMTRIFGRDLKDIIRDVESGERNARKEFSRPLLLRVFQDVCLAMAYAHDHGVVHRDLKPANVMVGKYGEVYVVDWGLAKVLGQKDDPSSTLVVPAGKDAPAPCDSNAPMLTMEGTVLGTPAYMPPEQADGRITEIDEKSDIYSLGSILYEILTFRPPFEGATGLNVIAKVLTGNLTPPSQKVSEIRQARKEAVGSAGGSGVRTPPPMTNGGEFPESVPPELESIVMKAMSMEKGARHASARELHDDVQRFLEGEKQREYNHERALAKVAEGKILIEKMDKARTDMKALEKEAEEKGKEIKPHWAADRKKDYWALGDRVRALRDEVVKDFTAAQGAFLEALGFERKNSEARTALADVYWAQFIREEQGGNRSEMVLYEGLVRQYNDGQYDENLKGDGALSISTRFFPCRCLTEGRTVKPDELDVMGYHPFSGRSLEGHKGAGGLPDLEPKEPIRLKVHGEECKTEPLAGADVWLLRFEEKDKLLLPRFPEKVAAAGAEKKEMPDAVLDRCYDPGSPYRPGGGRYLGRTPMGKIEIPMGSYLLIIAKEGFHPVRCPVFIARNGEESLDVTLYRDGEIPAGFVHVPAGKFIFQGDKDHPYSGPKEVKETDDCFVSKFPVTCREYVDFLNDLAVKDPAQAERRAPRKTPTTGVYWPKDAEGRFHIPTEKWLSEASEDMKKAAAKLDTSPVWWEEDWPVFSVSWEDLTAFAAWRSGREAGTFCLVHDLLWEKSARGVDGRFFPYGNFDDASFFNQANSHEKGMRPCVVDSFPVDESPCGVRGLAGNSRDLCLNDVGDEQWIGWRLCRGGFWSDSGTNSRAANRSVVQTSYVYYDLGGRLSWFPRCRTPKKG